MAVLVWYAAEQSGWSHGELTGPRALASVQGVPAPADGELADDTVQLQLVESFGDIRAVALVPPNLDQLISINGVPVSAGLHGLRHADQIHVGQQCFWISTATGVEEAVFDPEIHTEEFCFLTKSRLQRGDAIILCPGTPGVTCEKIYKKNSWDMAMRSTTLAKCMNCGFTPNQSEWQPPQAKERRDHDDILRLALQRGNGPPKRTIHATS